MATPNPKTNTQKNTPSVVRNVNNNVGQTPAAVTDVPDEKNDVMAKWLTEIYDPKLATEDFVKMMWENLSYKGFNRADVIKQLHSIAKDPVIAIQLIVVSALRGPQAGANIKLSNGRTPKEMGIPASGGQGSKILTLNKIQSATADLAAFYLKMMNVPKRMTSDLPAWLQFPSAGSISLPREYRDLHLEFSMKFSALIGGVFQEQIYHQMERNSYLEPKLRLFD
jgi:hypothetical protein